MAQLGKLQKVELRNVWETEDRDFTPWLAENIKILADKIGLDLEVEAVEKNVGPFRADILCKDTQNDSWVLIENQLEKTDHRHLGQLMTYAAGLQAVTIVWVADRFSEEHRAAMDWLNKITGDNFKFFALETELWKIDDSNPAAEFNVVTKPNNWSRSVSEASHKIETNIDSPLKQKQYEYWSYLAEFLINNGSFIKLTNPRPQSWRNFSIGRVGFHLSTTVHSKEKRIGVELYISDESAKDYFSLLYKDKNKIEEDIGCSLDWQELPDRKGSRIVVFKEGHFDNKDEWEKDMIWFKETLEKFDSVFRPIIKSLNLDDLDVEMEVAE